MTLIPKSLTAPLDAAPPMLPYALGDQLGQVTDQPLAKMPQLDSTPAPKPVYAPDPEQQMIDHDTQKLQKVQWNQDHPWGTAENHPGTWGKIAHVLSVAGNIGGNIVAPNVMANIPGTQLNMQGEQAGLAHRLSGEVAEQGKNKEQEAQTGLVNAEAAAEPQKAEDTHALSGAQARHINDEASLLENPPTELQHFAGDDGFYSFNPKSGEVKQLSYNGQRLTPKQKLSYETVTGPDGKPHTYAMDERGNKKIDEGEHFEKPTNINVGTWSLQNDTDGKPILFNSKTGETREAPANLARKPNAEELKRNDLAGNVNENLDRLTEIVTRRPDLFGPLAGRMTKAKEMIGTSDPDVASLKTIEDNLGMALQSAHGMRSAQHVETSAQSVLNGLKNSPEALKAAIATARASVGTFQHDVQNTNEAGRGADPKVLKFNQQTGRLE